MSKSFDILLVEDNPDLASNIIDYLEALGHRMHYAADGESGLREALVRPIDILLLDLALPNRDGLSVCSELRRCADRRIPILMLTARDTLDDKLAGFAHGADDYLVKPFSLAELAARVAALTLRPQLGQSHRFVVGPLTIDRQARIATRDGQPLRLTPLLWELLLLLAEAWPNPVSRDEATSRLWGDEPPSSDSLRAHLHLLRQVVDKPFDVPIIETVHSIGFRLKVAR
ncbi:MAG: XRE family transcriptional regulator [Blastomonas sp. CACIA14H2]|uniref:response regulator transcription factor n=1 Tax=unclassified Blastomonas TaxID=2626550 RepID=UPI0003D04C51|nr:response regulator transcription factor [Blastomonas sp. UPD001]ESZ88977.1 MAG: XRE family transcriptional regulator [Blastomonas sp. CACIA14H2]